MKMNEKSKKALLDLRDVLMQALPKKFISIRFTGSSLGYKENPNDIDINLFFTTPLTKREREVIRVTIEDIQSIHGVEFGIAKAGDRAYMTDKLQNPISNLKKSLLYFGVGKGVEVTNDLFTGWHVGNTNKLRKARIDILKTVLKSKNPDRLWAMIQHSSEFPGKFGGGPSGITPPDNIARPKATELRSNPKFKEIEWGIREAHYLPDLKKAEQFYIDRARRIERIRRRRLRK